MRNDGGRQRSTCRIVILGGGRIGQNLNRAKDAVEHMMKMELEQHDNSGGVEEEACRPMA